MEENQTELQTMSNEQNSTTAEEAVKTTQLPVNEASSQPETEVGAKDVKADNVSESQTISAQQRETSSQSLQTEATEQSQSVQEESPVTPVAPIPPFVARANSETTPPPLQSGTNFVQSPMGDGVRKLKKIKRPVKRLVQGNPVPPSSQMINLDELLDSQMNLPTTINTPSNNSSFRQENETRQVSNTTEKKHFQPRFINENELEKAPRFIDQLMVDNLFTYKGAAVIAGVVFLLTLIIGMMLFGGETIVKDGLQGVIVNAEVPRGRARCGVAERTQGCVLYIMNPQRQDLQGRDFYDLASQLTGRQRFVIETGNMRYSNIKIRAGEIAQINIPPLQ